MQFIISDIHGCYYTLKSLIDKVVFADPNPELIFLGDYVDRGLNSNQTIEFLLEIEQKYKTHFLMGNHDNVVNYLLSGSYLGKLSEMITNPQPTTVVKWWLSHGFAETLMSYGVQKGTIKEILEQFQLSVPDSHKDFFRKLKLFWENDTHFAIHAYFCPSTELPISLKFVRTEWIDSMLWSRFDRDLWLLKKTIAWDKIGVFGHTPVSVHGFATPIKYEKLRLIDTGAFIGEYLCAYNCQTDDWILEPTDSRDIVLTVN